MPSQDSLRFYVQVGFSTIVLFFCLFKLANPSDNQSSALYWGGVTSVLAWWMPSPGGSSPSRNENEVPTVQIEKLEAIQQLNSSQN
jgi:hypothetical protein